MSCIDRFKPHRAWLGLGVLAVLAGCTNAPRPSAPIPPAPSANNAPSRDLPSRADAPVAPPAAPTPALTPLQLLGPPKPVRTHAELRQQVALRLVAANPERTYMGEVPAILLAIPVLEVDLHADGRVKKIIVVRKPGQAPETVQMAIDAVNRAAPFGNVSRMPEPWKFTETFLFNDERRFKPRTLD